MTKVGLIGASGRLGSAIVRLAQLEPAAFSINRIDKKEGAQIIEHASIVHVLLDVSTPSATIDYLMALDKTIEPKPYIVGCTGWTDTQKKILQKYSEKAPVVFAPNFSPAIHLLCNLLQQAAPYLKKWGYRAFLEETHHIHKKDAPSGTAKLIAESLKPLVPEIQSLREGEIIGIHEVEFLGSEDTLTFRHEATNRDLFARGALLACQWARAQMKPGLYSMQEVLFQNPKRRSP